MIKAETEISHFYAINDYGFQQFALFLIACLINL